MTAPESRGRAAPGHGAGAGELLWVNFRAMDTDIEVLVEAPPARRREAARLLAWTRRWFALLERRLSRFRPDSDVARVNRQAGAGFVRVTGLTAAVLARALVLAGWSGGLFDPAGLAVLEAAGYDRPLAELRRPGARPGTGCRGEKPGPDPVPRPFLGNYRSVVLDRRARAVALPPGMGLDLGGIAKGWAADVAARVLGTVGPALVNAGGDLAAGTGPRAAGGLWRVAVDGLPGRVLGVARCGVATSGVDRRRWLREGREWHHLLDPRTGRPAAGGFRRVTAIAPTAAQAEVAAKAILILGPRRLRSGCAGGRASWRWRCRRGVTRMAWSFLRATGITAYLLLWASTCLGLMGRGRLAAGLGAGAERWWLEAHRWLGLLGMAFTAAHMGGLLVDRHTPFSWAALLVPGAAPVRAAGSALGTLAFYGFLVALAAAGLRRRLGAGAWQVLHGLSVTAFGLALVHGVVTGTDGELPWMRATYASTGTVFLVFAFYRAFQAWQEEVAGRAGGGRLARARVPAGMAGRDAS